MKEVDISKLAEKPHSPLCDALISMKELTSVLATLQKRKAQGLDEIPPTFLKSASEKVKTALLQIFNKILRTGRFPKAWKSDRRTPVHKKGDPTKCANYRLLAIHSVFRKLFCTIADKRMRQIVELDDSQNGVRSGRRCSHNLVIVQNILKQASHKNSKRAHVLVADFTPASWTPMFLGAAAVVVESAGLLSHAAIICRELGIPAVVRTPAATTRIPDGAVVEVDGVTGIVTIVQDPPPAEPAPGSGDLSQL